MSDDISSLLNIEENKDTKPTTAKEAGGSFVAISGTKAVIARLTVVSVLVMIIWTILGILIGLAVGIIAGGSEVKTAGVVIGGIMGFVIGFLLTVVIDWLKQMLVLQEKIADSKKTDPSASPTPITTRQ